MFPPNDKDRAQIFLTTCKSTAVVTVGGARASTPDLLAAQTGLFTPADIGSVVELTLRRALLAAGRINDGQPPSPTMIAMLELSVIILARFNIDDALRGGLPGQSGDLGPDVQLRWLTARVAAAAEGEWWRNFLRRSSGLNTIDRPSAKGTVSPTPMRALRLLNQARTGRGPSILLSDVELEKTISPTDEQRANFSTLSRDRIGLPIPSCSTFRKHLEDV